MKAVVVALGQMGLPLTAQIASAGHQVIGCDIDERTVRLVAGGQAPFPGEPGWRSASPRPWRTGA